MNFKKFKRLASVMLSLSMVLSTNMTAFATETNSLPSENTAIVSDETPAECPHDWEFLRYMREPTCTTTGVAIYECQLENCTNIQGLKYEPVPALGHKFDPNAADYHEGEGYTVVENPEATCQQEGTLTFTCQREINGAACNGTKTETTPKTDHEWDEENPKNSPASCTKPAMTYIGCKHCDAIKPDSEQPDTEQPALGHGYERDDKVENTDFTKNTVAATCTTGGYVEYTCLLCAETTEGHTSTPEAEKTPALKHGYARDNRVENTDFTKSTVNATCTDGGYVEYTCLHCAETTEGHTIKPESEKTPALKHGYERDNAVEGTDYEKETVPATCTTDGYVEYTCKHCADAVEGHTSRPESEKTPALKHGYERTDAVEGTDYEKETVPATCTTDGYVEYTCKHCADAVEGHTSRPESEKTPALKHGYERTDAVEGTDYEKETVPATCTTDGYVEYTCKHCAVDVEGHTSRPADQIVTGAHIWGTEKVQISEANCKEPAQYDFVCTRCNDKKGETEARGEIDTTKHIWTADPVIFKAETCTANGLGRITCSFCQNDSQIIIIPAGHNYGEWDITPATCTADGSKTRTCQRDTCPDIETEGHAHQEVVSIPATGHDYGENAAESVKTEATCVVKGVVTKTCANGCGTTQDVEGTVDPENHANWSQDGEHAATCTRDRITGVYCTDCGTLGENATSEPGTATGHAFENMTNEQFEETYGPQEDNPDAKSYVEVTKEANCTEAGEKIFTCPTCEASPEEGNTKTVTVSALGHNFQDKYTAPTCTDNGKTQLTCTRLDCNATNGPEVDLYELTGEESEKATGHNFTELIDTYRPASCTRNGIGIYKCKTCDETANQTIPGGHDYGDWVTIAATCTANGSKTRTCQRDTCPDIETEGHAHQEVVSIPATGHDYGENAAESVKTEATCVVKGVVTKTCANGCGTTQDVEGTVDPENHANWSQDGEHAATCTRDRITGVYCTDCGTLGENATSEPGTATGHAFENMTNEQFEETYGPQEDNPDAKSYVEVTKEANCTEAGEKIFTCPTCEASPEEGNTKTVTVSALGHNFQDKYTAPTCTDNGKTQLTCARQGCNATSGQAVDLFVLLGEESEKALGHDPVKIPEVKATCIAPGSTEGVKCQRAECQEVLTATQPIDIDTVNGHDYQETEEIQEWTCTQDGIKEFTCSLCSNVKTETTPAGHDWFVGFSGDEKFHEYVGNADCADDGAILYRVCTRASADDCDFTGDFHGVEVVLEMPGTGLCPTCQKYVWKVTVPGQDATCTEDGFTESETCSSCSHVFKQAEPINALGHKDTTWKVQTAPTCVDAGVEAETCGVCNQPTGVTRPISATGIHKYVDVLVDGDCTHDDTIYSRCETCKQDEPGKAPQVFEGTALGHDFVNDICTRCEKRRIAVSTQFNKYVEDGKNKIRFTSIVEVVDTETYEPIEMGVLYITSKDYDGDGSNLTIEGNTQEPLIVKKQQTNNFNLDGYYVAISVGTSTDRVLWGRGFVKVKNKKTEEEETFYGEIVHGNFINGVVSKQENCNSSGRMDARISIMKGESADYV